MRLWQPDISRSRIAHDPLGKYLVPAAGLAFLVLLRRLMRHSSVAAKYKSSINKT